MVATGVLSDNIAYADMTCSHPVVSDANGKGGRSVTLEEIYELGVLDYWLERIEIPEYLRLAEEEGNTLDVIGEQGEALGTAEFFFTADLPANKVNLMELRFEYDGAELFDFEAESLISGATVNTVTVADGEIFALIGVPNESAIANAGPQNIVKFTAAAKQGETPESITLKLVSAKLFEKGVPVEYDVANWSNTVVLNYRLPLDVNGDGVVDLADLSLMLYYYGAAEGDDNWEEAKWADVNKDGVVDTLDVTMLIEALYS